MVTEPDSHAAVNYHHWGDAKRWYGIPSAAAAAFEAAFKKALPEKFDMQPDLLFHLTAMLSPRVLRQHNVPVFGVVQVRLEPAIDVYNKISSHCLRQVNNG